ncbi:hypothetical protein [Laribacter hongkongensis]|uniref:hypothetical protein n=1 Tax=Laribacter hongkongensis TaxID=168471 RepID=UPI001EFCFDD9|nr:hypothetical protein [Laribacter hongkongensis]MCG9078955.1 hypothetical protein [Laribacter hongkongensis]
MAGFVTTEREQDVLRYVPHLAQVLYHALHARMNFRDGMVGRASLISYQMLREAAEYFIPRGRGCQRVQPSEKEVRGALARLMCPKDDKGRPLPPLLVRRGDDFQLEFSMPLALADSVRPFETRQANGRRKSENSQLNQCDDGNESGQDGQTGHTSVESVKSVDVGGSGGSSGDGGSFDGVTTTDGDVSKEDAMKRAEALCRGLRTFRVVVHPSELREGVGRALLDEFSDQQILRRAERLHQRHFADPDKTFNLGYLVRVMADERVTNGAAPLSRRGSAGGSKGTSKMPWYLLASGLEAKALELGIVLTPEAPVGAQKVRIMQAAGVTQHEYEAACRDYGVPVRY